MARPRLNAEVLPVLTVRVPEEQRDLVRRVVQYLRDPAGEAEVRALLESPPASPPLGPFINEEAAIQHVARALVAHVRPRQIWLFGSRARRDHRPGSDIDILVVGPDDQPLTDEKCWRAITASGLAVDLLVCTETEFNHDYLPDSIIEQIHLGHGRRLYADKQTRIAERQREAAPAV